MVSIIDIIAVLVLGYTLYKGYRLGLITIVFDFLAFSFSFYMAGHYYKQLGSFLQKHIHLRVSWSDVMTWDNVLVWILAYILFFIIFKFIGFLITKLFNNTFLSDWNKYVGMLLNGIKWLIVLWILIALIMQLPFQKLKVYCQKSVTYKAYKVASSFVPVNLLFPTKLR